MKYDRTDLVGSVISVLDVYKRQVAYSVPASAVADRIMNVTVKEIPTGIDIGDECLDTDGTIIYSRLVNFLAGNAARNRLIEMCIRDSPVRVDAICISDCRIKMQQSVFYVRL